MNKSTCGIYIDKATHNNNNNISKNVIKRYKDGKGRGGKGGRKQGLQNEMEKTESIQGDGSHNSPSCKKDTCRWWPGF